MGVRKTRAERKQETRRRLLDAAAEVFARRGFHGASVEDIAAHAGFTQGALYANFAGKEGLFLAVIDDSPESDRAVTFAAHRVKRTGGTVVLLSVIDSADFQQFLGVEDVMRAEARASVVASDLSIGMLAVARSRGIRGAVADLARLPFADRSFDAVTLGFVLSHVGKPIEALREIQRVLSNDGRVAISAWRTTAGASDPGRLWRQVAEEFVSASELDATALGLPSEELLSTPAGLRSTLESAGFESIAIEEREYAIAIRTEAFLRTRFLTAAARWMQLHMSSERWSAFVAEAARRLHDHFGSELRFPVGAHFAIASNFIRR